LTISPVKDANEVIVGASKIARDITERKRIVAERGHSLTVNLAPEPLIVEADPVRLAQVLSNLLNNAAKFTKSGGEIRIDLEPQDAHAELKTRDMGHDVRVAFNGPSARKLMGNFVPDVALIDLGLPLMDGYQLARWLREQPQCRDIILIAQTGWGREEDRKRAREAGFDHHLVKPIDHQRLVEILADASNKKPEDVWSCQPYWNVLADATDMTSSSWNGVSPRVWSRILPARRGSTDKRLRFYLAQRRI
jgi:CheY-like chemotaxis protein